MKGPALAILIGKGKKESMMKEDKEEADYKDEGKMEYSEDIMSAIKAGDAAALKEALSDFVKLCMAEY